ncbi:MAG: hypothetical protein DID89_2727547323 [Candidatus Nitrotoga sp. CP45]|nr:MAG: hypothetical protein DID89_2727547323 [Candidatus Nitrotoga sp. CP45]
MTIIMDSKLARLGELKNIRAPHRLPEGKRLNTPLILPKKWRALTLV